ncbi:type IV toxin-antitoxin system AbiEi family antitoxin [Verrucomicrobiota bacterium]
MLYSANVMKRNCTSIGRRRGAAAAFVEDRLAEGRVAFAMTELVAETGLSVVAANNQLKRLGARIRRITRPQSFFLIVDPIHRAMGAPPLEWWLDAYFRWLAHPYYLALLSAAESHGTAPQAVQVHQVMTDTPRREITVGRIRVRFFVKRGVERIAVQQPVGAYAPLRVSTPEVTALDLLSYAPRIGGVGRARETIASLVPLMRIGQLRQALDAERSMTTAQRLGYILELSGADRLAGAVHDWLPSEVRWCSLRPGPTNEAKLQRSERWHVLVDEKDFA